MKYAALQHFSSDFIMGKYQNLAIARLPFRGNFELEKPFWVLDQCY
jgi:hypothetical protein